MGEYVSIIITIASFITALEVIFGAVFAFHNWVLKREKNDSDIKAIKEELKRELERVNSMLDKLNN